MRRAWQSYCHWLSVLDREQYALWCSLLSLGIGVILVTTLWLVL